MYFGSQSSIATQQGAEVRLTKFNSITMDAQNDQSSISSPKSERTVQSFDETKSLSAVDLLQTTTTASSIMRDDKVNNTNSANRWSWFKSPSNNGKRTNHKCLSANGVCSIVSQQINQEVMVSSSSPVQGEDFQIVWSKLAFDVILSSYDRFMNKAASKIRNLWPSKGSELRGHLEGEAEFGDSLDSLGGLEKRVIFENLNGLIRSGEVSAILGPSGAGKTSLLNAICGKTDGYRGSILVKGGGKRRMRLSIIPQKDYLNGHLTVRENLLYSSKILNTSKEFDHEANILRVVKMLNLISCFESSAANISGGEYKRVSIAQELLRQPDILILDEPTSGLDSLNCKKLIQSLIQLIEASKRGAFNPVAIVMTIHQPDIELFQMFDHIYCMARHGKVIFDGHPREAMHIIKEKSGIPEDQLNPNSGIVNPANLLIEIASRDLYGQDPIDRLSDYQLSQFEQKNFVITAKNASKKLLKSQASIKLELQKADNLLICAEKNSSSTGKLSGKQIGESVKSTDSSLILFQNQNSTDIPLEESKLKKINIINNKNNLKNEQTMINKQNNSLIRDKRLTIKNDHSGKFWHHTHLLASRAFTSTLRDPLMTVSSMLFHLFIPFVMWTVYNQQIGKVTACPAIQREMDMISLASNNTLGKVQDLHEQLMSALECSTMFFLSTYSFSMCSLTVAALAFPLNMHILLKEVRNGWYSLPSYVVAKTIASFPFEVLFPVISIVMIYLMLGMPSSYMEWRLWLIALVMALISMISNTQGLIFGALCMDSVQSAIFLASSSSLPLTLLSGFTARIKGMPILLQRLSWFSLYRYSSDSINMIRFGFNMCPCDNSTADYLRNKAATFVDVPQSMRPLFTYYLGNSGDATTSSPGDDNTTTTTMATTLTDLTTSSVATTATNYTTNFANMTSSISSSLANTTTNYLSDFIEFIPGVSKELTLSTSERSDLLKRMENNEVDLFERMANLMARSFTYGREVDNCKTLRSELLMSAGAPDDEFLPFLFGGMIGLLVAAKIILFIVVKFKIGKRV